MRRLVATALAVGALIAGVAGSASAKATKSVLFHDGDVVRTVVPPSALPHGGTDPFYSVTNGVVGQLGIAGVAPGDGPYHGGAWAMNTVTFNQGVSPYLLTSDDAVFAAEGAGDVTVTRVPEADFRCPIQP
jgi:ABC-type branched-subunit amino acid transport system permease subunit